MTLPDQEVRKLRSGFRPGQWNFGAIPDRETLTEDDLFPASSGEKRARAPFSSHRCVLARLRG